MVPYRARRRARILAWRLASAVRHHYMLGVTAIVLGLAAAGGLGFFDDPAPRSGGTTVPASPPAPLAFVPGAARTAVPVRPFEFNVFLVSTPEEQRALQVAENQYRSPYLLGGRASEVLLVRTPDDELMAAHRVEEVRMSFPGANVVVTDLRE